MCGGVASASPGQGKSLPYVVLDAQVLEASRKKFKTQIQVRVSFLKLRLKKLKVRTSGKKHGRACVRPLSWGF